MLRLLESTLESVSKAIDDAGQNLSDLDAVLLVGGSTRTPLVSRTLEERTGLVPRQEMHPDLSVALGAGVLASRLSGKQVERVLVDVSPFSIGPSYLGERGGVPYPYCYKPLIRRNTPLPVTRTESYHTAFPNQTEVEVRVYQGEDDDALKNIPVGNFTIEKLMPLQEMNEVLCRMNLDVDGILRVSAIEKRTGKSKQITIESALTPKTDEDIAAARQRLEPLYVGGVAETELDEIFEESAEPWPLEEEEEDEDQPDKPAKLEEEPVVVKDSGDREWPDAVREAFRLVERSRSLLDKMHDEDKEDAIELNADVETAVAQTDWEFLTESRKSLEELLFFVEGK